MSYWHELSNWERENIRFGCSETTIGDYFQPAWCGRKLALDFDYGCKDLIQGRVLDFRNPPCWKCSYRKTLMSEVKE